MFFVEPTNRVAGNTFLPLPVRGSDEMAELTVLLPGSQAQALEEAAHHDGLTTAQYLRRLIGQALRATVSRRS